MSTFGPSDKIVLAMKVWSRCYVLPDVGPAQDTPLGGAIFEDILPLSILYPLSPIRAV